MPVLHREHVSDSEQEPPVDRPDGDAVNDSAGEIEAKDSAFALQLADVMEGTRVPAGTFAFTLSNSLGIRRGLFCLGLSMAGIPGGYFVIVAPFAVCGTS